LVRKLYTYTIEENIKIKQVVYTFSGKKYTESFVAVKSDVVFSSIIITNILKMVKSTKANARAKHFWVENN